jgi:hypothetical protein
VFVGVARIQLQVPGARSLKDKRRAVKSFKDRARARLPLSIAEVGDLDRHQLATLGVAVVSGQAARCDEILSAAVSMARTLADAVLLAVATEVVPFGTAGRGVRGGLEQRFAASLDPGDAWDDDEDEP